MRKLHLLLVLLISFTTFAQIQEPVKWSSRVEQISSTEIDLIFTADIDPAWHLYSQYQEGMGMPLVFTITESADFKSKLNGKFLSETPKYVENYNAEFDDTERYLDGKAEFKYRIQVLNQKPFVLKAKVEGQACQEGRCVQVENSFKFNINGATSESIIEEDNSVKAAPVFSAGSLLIDDSEDEAEIVAVQEEEESLFGFFILAFLGGLLGILTPCVFPMIPMTVSFFLKHDGRKQAIFYGVSIVVIYVLIGIILSAIFGEGVANFISTHWAPNLLFAGIFVIFAVSLFGYFEIRVPSWMINKSASNESKAGYLGTFFMALTLVLVSFSCTLPIAGAVALNAASGNFLKPIIGMLGFSLAFALPFTFFAFFPKMLKNLPKSGGWMNTLKVILAFVELAFALKFINVPDQTYLWGILDREIYLAIWIVIFSMLGFYLIGKLKFPLDDDYPVQKSWFRFGASIATFSFVVYMIPGLFGAPLNGLSGWLPPMNTQDFDINRIVYNASKSAGHSAKASTSLCEIPYFSDKLHLPTGLEGYFDYDQALACAKEQNKPVFIDFTGHGCVNCRQIEQKVLSNPQIQELLMDNYIVCELFVDDKTIALPEELYIKDEDGNTITMLGAKNSYIQRKVFKQNSQPCFILVTPEGKVITDPLFFETDINKFSDFLRKGI